MAAYGGDPVRRRLDGDAAAPCARARRAGARQPAVGARAGGERVQGARAPARPAQQARPPGRRGSRRACTSARVRRRGSSGAGRPTGLAVRRACQYVLLWTKRRGPPWNGGKRYEAGLRAVAGGARCYVERVSSTARRALALELVVRAALPEAAEREQRPGAGQPPDWDSSLGDCDVDLRPCLWACGRRASSGRARSRGSDASSVAGRTRARGRCGPCRCGPGGGSSRAGPGASPPRGAARSRAAAAMSAVIVPCGLVPRPTPPRIAARDRARTARLGEREGAALGRDGSPAEGVDDPISFASGHQLAYIASF